MRSLLWILPLFLISLALAYPTAIAQNVTNTTGNGTETGGLSSESVNSAQSNTTGAAATNTTGNGTETGGLSSESVNSAQSNTTGAAATNTTGNGTETGGLSSESVNSTK